LFTRTAIDKYTGTAKDGMLYSIEAVTGTDEENNIVLRQNRRNNEGRRFEH